VTVELVLTERRSELSESRARNYERLRARLGEAAGRPVAAAHYEDVDGWRLARASAVVLSGSSAPWSVHEPAELERLGDAVRASGRPVLGICAGLQLQTLLAGGSIAPAAAPERGFKPVEVHDRSDLLRGLPPEIVVFHDHVDEVTALPDGFRLLASSAACAVQAFADPERRWWGTQFHPEEFDVEHPAGEQILRTFFELAQ
jgi:GMP synthase (glutamine-hydrolysing)